MTSPQKKRVCIVGTAESWKKTPWDDPSVEIWSLNDAYALGFKRADRWFELHPIDHFYYRKANAKTIKASEIPPGHYVRPEGHMEWLKTTAATIPVYLQKEPPAGWPVNAKRFPIEQVQATFGDSYWACGPSYMLALAFLEGYSEIWITGIHLATAGEYREQRPQWENLIGRLLGPSVTERTENGFRYYDGAVSIVLPDECPIMKHGWKYAYEPKPVVPPNPFDVELKAVLKEKDALITALVTWPKGKDKSRQIERLQRLEIAELDIRQCAAKRNIGGTLTAKIAA